jgi:hypothetical protein
MAIEKCRLVELIDDELTASDYPVERFVQAMADKGFIFMGENHTPRQREELQGAPKFQGLCGPMWDDGKWRYETVKAYASLSM